MGFVQAASQRNMSHAFRGGGDMINSTKVKDLREDKDV